MEAIPKMSYSEIKCHKVLYLLECASDNGHTLSYEKWHGVQYKTCNHCFNYLILIRIVYLVN